VEQNPWLNFITVNISILAAGELIFENGKLTAITDKSGHYETSIEMVVKG
jgi:hypothetical protein